MRMGTERTAGRAATGSAPSSAPVQDPAASLLPFARTAALVAIGALVAIVVTAIVLRFFDLASLPGGLYPDEAAEGLDAQRMLHEPGYHPEWFVWFTNDGGREALFALSLIHISEP